MNILPVTQSATTITMGTGQTLTVPKAVTGCHYFGVRPEHLEACTKAKSQITGAVTHLEQLGESALAHVTLADDTKITAKLPAETGVSVGDTIHLAAAKEKHHFFDADGIAIS